MSTTRFLLLFLVFPVMFGCDLFSKKQKTEVGGIQITEADITLRDEVEKIYNPRDTRKLGKAKLVKGQTFAQILGKYGRKITRDQLVAEAKRIDQATLLPQKLNQIKEVFAEDYDA